MKHFKLPDLGEGLTEADIVRWLVAEGDTVAVDQPMVEVETAKALVEVPSPYAGTVLTLHGAEGETMDVGSPLITIGEAGESGEGSAPVAGTETLAVPPSTGAAAAEADRPGALSYREEEMAGVQPKPDKARGGDGDVAGSDDEHSLTLQGTGHDLVGPADEVPAAGHEDHCGEYSEQNEWSIPQGDSHQSARDDQRDDRDPAVFGEASVVIATAIEPGEQAEEQLQNRCRRERGAEFDSAHGSLPHDRRGEQPGSCPSDKVEGELESRLSPPDPRGQPCRPRRTRSRCRWRSHAHSAPPAKWIRMF